SGAWHGPRLSADEAGQRGHAAHRINFPHTAPVRRDAQHAGTRLDFRVEHGYHGKARTEGRPRGAAIGRTIDPDVGAHIEIVAIGRVDGYRIHRNVWKPGVDGRDHGRGTQVGDLPNVRVGRGRAAAHIAPKPDIRRVLVVGVEQDAAYEP